MNTETNRNTTATAVFGGGCFWCTEAIYLTLRGVLSVESGYAGGSKRAPTYEDVSSGETGHAEVVSITFDPRVIAYRDLLAVFFMMHDPTTPNRQGADTGTQYRSIILTTSEEQVREARAFISGLRERREFRDPIVTEIAPLGEFYPAEAYHQDYYANNRSAPYCSLVITPKLAKLRERFAGKMAS